MRNINKSLIILFLVSIIVIPNHTLAKRAAIIIDYETKKVLFEKNADTLNYPASLTKMMTLYIVFDYLKKNKLNWNTKMRVSKRAASQQPSKLYLEGGSTIIGIDNNRNITTTNTAQIDIDCSGAMSLNSSGGAISIGNDLSLIHISEPTRPY